MFEGLEEKRRFEAHVIEKAYKDKDFRAALRDDPQGALAEAYGREMPWQINIHSDSMEEMHLVLPIFEDELPDELTDEQLERVDGGCGAWSCIFFTF